MLLGASHGSADHYELNGDKIIPITKEQKEEKRIEKERIRRNRRGNH